MRNIGITFAPIQDRSLVFEALGGIMVIALDEKKEVKDSRDVVEIITNILNMEEENDQMKEHFWVIGVNVRNQIQYIELVTLGILTAVLVHPREVFRLAIQKSVNRIILAHNHPSGDTTPSIEDKKLTAQLTKAGEILEIKVLDHVIVTLANGYTSLSEGGF